MRPASRLHASFAALLALAVLAFAQVRADTMQAAELAGLDCGMSAAAMAGMPGMAAASAEHAPGPAHHAACPYCAAAAHAPTLAQGVVLRLPVAVAWAASPAAAPPPIRGPPPPPPRARGPPPAPLTA